MREFCKLGSPSQTAIARGYISEFIRGKGLEPQERVGGSTNKTLTSTDRVFVVRDLIKEGEEAGII